MDTRDRAVALEQEIATYENRKPELLRDEGKFVLVQGNDLGGVFDTYEDAIKAGYDKYALKPFLVKQIHAIEHIQHFSRELDPCRT